MSDGFVLRKELLEETSKLDDLLDLSVQSGQLASRIDKLDGAFVLALVGPYGSGKSTMLNRIMSEREEGGEHWVEFDAWKYPDRKDLWEGFVLELAKSISPDAFEEATNKVEGKENSDVMTVMSLLSKIPGLAVLEGLNTFLETSPARRVDDIYEILTEQISCLDKNLFVIVEDIDRSGDAGIFFLETLKQFLRDTDFNKKVAVIVPIANENYHEYIESYLKCIDYFEFFENNEITFDAFVDAIFDPDLFTKNMVDEFNQERRWTGRHRRTQTISFLEELYRSYSYVTMRLLKLILRKADLVYRQQKADGHQPDFRVTICIEASKYIYVTDQKKETFFERFKKSGIVDSGNIFASFLLIMYCDIEDIYRYDEYGERRRMDRSIDFEFFERTPEDKINDKPSIPWRYKNWENEGYGITKFYIRY